MAKAGWGEQRIRAGLRFHGLTQATVARRASVPVSHVRSTISGTKLDAVVVNFLSREFKKPATALFGRSQIRALTNDGFSVGTGSNAYEGATTGRRLGVWGLSNAGPNSASGAGGNSLRARAREFIRNNGWAQRAVNSWSANMIGTGIVPVWHFPENQNLARYLADRFSRWSEEADADGTTDWYGLQALATSTWFSAGECLGRFRLRTAKDGLSVPLQIQLLEPDHFDDSVDGILSNGNSAKRGIEFDLIGKRFAYWLFRQHPGDQSYMSGTGGFGSVRIPAQEIMHLFGVDRPGQARGVSRFASILVRLYTLDLFEDAHLVRQQIANLLVGFAFPETGDLTTGLPGYTEGTDTNDQTQMRLEAGTISIAPRGVKNIEWSKPPTIDGTYADFEKTNLRAIAAGLGVTYEQMTGDLSEVNYSSIRAGLIEFWRQAEQEQWKCVIPQFCRPTVKRWLDVGFASGKLDLPGYSKDPWLFMPLTWRPPRWRWVDPAREVDAEIRAVRAGFKSRGDVVADMGEDIARVDERIAEDKARADRLGLVLDSDPSEVAISGQTQIGGATNPVADGTPSDSKPVKKASNANTKGR